MASISGMETKIGFVISSTWGTEVACTKLIGLESFSQSLNPAELSHMPIGVNAKMARNAQQGAIAPAINFRAKMGYGNYLEYFIAQFMGTSGAPAEQTASQGDYKHTITYNTTLNSKLLTVAQVATSTGTLAWPSAAVTEMSIEAASPPNWVFGDFALTANNRITNSAANTTGAGVGTATASTDGPAVVDLADSFLCNTQAGGALSSGDRVNITSYRLTLRRPQESVAEIKGSAGNGAPRATGPFEGELEITLKELADFTWLSAVGTNYKSKISWDGAQIGSGVNRSFSILLPSMTLIQDPEYNVTDLATNPLTLRWKLMEASANPTGMSSTTPYFEVINTTSTSLLA